MTNDFRKTIEAAEASIELAQIYLRDGALATCAANLRLAADLFDRAAELKTKGETT